MGRSCTHPQPRQSITASLTLEAGVGVDIVGLAVGVFAVHFAAVEVDIVEADVAARRLVRADKLRAAPAPGPVDLFKEQLANGDEVGGVRWRRPVVGVHRYARPCVLDRNVLPSDVFDKAGTVRVRLDAAAVLLVFNVDVAEDNVLNAPGPDRANRAAVPLFKVAVFDEDVLGACPHGPRLDRHAVVTVVDVDVVDVHIARPIHGVDAVCVVRLHQFVCLRVHVPPRSDVDPANLDPVDAVQRDVERRGVQKRHPCHGKGGTTIHHHKVGSRRDFLLVK
mmetsp:Transcript_23138/g.60464  ORF Transcript_23138/g.60464 Transcript_23138/m.60464 type:complete len:279 (+) Transcript_23138:131-967(+)